MKPIVHLHRKYWEEQQTRGDWYLLSGQGLIFRCVTMELPWLGNSRGISCIPTGFYKVKRRTSQKYGEHWHVTDVPDRTFILIHPMNYNRDSKGCIGLGASFVDIDGDGLKDITSSRKTCDEFDHHMEGYDEFDLYIS